MPAQPTTAPQEEEKAEEKSNRKKITASANIALKVGYTKEELLAVIGEILEYDPTSINIGKDNISFNFERELDDMTKSRKRKLGNPTRRSIAGGQS